LNREENMPDSIGTLSEQLGPKKLLLLLICRVRLYSDAMVNLLAQHEGLRVIGSLNVAPDVVTEVEAAAPDVVLLDMGTPGAGALAVAILRARPRTRILGLGVDEVPLQVVACAEAGLCGYVPAHASTGDLARAARWVAAGGTICSPEMAGHLFRYLGTTGYGAQPTTATLTQRQLEILHLIGEGLSNKEIARRLSLETSTVKNHVHNLLGRLQVAGRVEAARLNFDWARRV
jgi:DNA-binding NarL/FixJ family response regulator